MRRTAASRQMPGLLRQPRVDAGAMARHRLDLTCPTQFSGPLAHRGQPDPGARARRQPDPIVTNLHIECIAKRQVYRTCSRSIPRERRKRTTSAPATRRRRPEEERLYCWRVVPARRLRRGGQTDCVAGSARSAGGVQCCADEVHCQAQAGQATSRQRGAGRRPSGKSRNTNVNGRKVTGIQSQRSNQRAMSLPGKGTSPGRSTIA